MESRFSLSEFGHSFATRGRGAELREEFLAREGDGGVVIDLEGVDHVSYSFADEFFGKLAAAGTINAPPEHASPTIARIVGAAMGRRAPDSVSC